MVVLTIPHIQFMEIEMSSLTETVRNYIEARLAKKCEPLDTSIAKLDDADPARDPLALKRQSLVDKHQPSVWLTDASARAAQIQLVSHAPKYSHSYNKARGYLSQSRQSDCEGLLSSSHSKNINYDFIGNAAVFDVANLLRLNADGQCLIDWIRAGDISPLLPLADNAEQATQWLAEFREALNLNKTNSLSHALSKQAYWPLGSSEKKGYHLISPLFASSQQQAFYQRVQAARFGETQKAARDARKENADHPEPTRHFPALAQIAYGGTKPQNISLLNSQRGGIAYLLPATPPKWQQREQLFSDSALWRQLSWRGRDALTGLLKALRAIEQSNAKMSLQQRKQWRDRELQTLFDVFWIIIAEQRAQNAPEQHSLSKHWATLLGWQDAHAPDVAQLLSEDFARELAHLLSQRQSKLKLKAAISFSDAHVKTWEKFFIQELRGFTPALLKTPKHDVSQQEIRP
jgi:CRISPR-associated protein Csy1